MGKQGAQVIKCYVQPLPQDSATGSTVLGVLQHVTNCTEYEMKSFVRFLLERQRGVGGSFTWEKRLLRFASLLEANTPYRTWEDRSVTFNNLGCQRQVAPSCLLRCLWSILTGRISIPKVNTGRALYALRKRASLTKKMTSAAVFADVHKVIWLKMSINMYWLQNTNYF